MATRIGRSPGAVVRRACSQVAAVAAGQLRGAADGVRPWGSFRSVPTTHAGAVGATTAYGLLLAVVTSMQIRSPLDIGGHDDDLSLGTAWVRARTGNGRDGGEKRARTVPSS